MLWLEEVQRSGRFDLPLSSSIKCVKNSTVPISTRIVAASGYSANWASKSQTSLYLSRCEGRLAMACHHYQHQQQQQHHQQETQQQKQKQHRRVYNTMSWLEGTRTCRAHGAQASTVLSARSRLTYISHSRAAGLLNHSNRLHNRSGS